MRERFRSVSVKVSFGIDGQFRSLFTSVKEMGDACVAFLVVDGHSDR